MKVKGYIAVWPKGEFMAGNGNRERLLEDIEGSDFYLSWAEAKGNWTEHIFPVEIEIPDFKIPVAKGKIRE